MPARIRLQGFVFPINLTGEPGVVYTGDMSARPSFTQSEVNKSSSIAGSLY